jgi:dipeptidyl aminopeptidase/acylaminoacyl peptidase
MTASACMRPVSAWSGSFHAIEASLKGRLWSVSTIRLAPRATHQAPEGKALLMERSPLNSADKIRTPLLIAQGANDPRVPRRQAEQIVIALRDRGFPVEYYLAPDEGHGFARPINNLALHMAEEKFLAEHLGGRFQAGGTPEEVTQLKEIMVNPRSIVSPK